MSSAHDCRAAASFNEIGRVWGDWYIPEGGGICAEKQAATWCGLCRCCYNWRMEPATPAPGADSHEPPIRFVLSEPLLQELRAHRDRARAERAARPLPPRLPPVQPTPGERIIA